jgi:hypothetical protein
VLAVLALTSALLAAAHALLGSRYAKYDRLQWEVAVEAERVLPEHLTLIDRIHSLRQNAAAEGPTGERYELSAVERLVSISRLLVWAPSCLGDFRSGCGTSGGLWADPAQGGRRRGP